MLRIVLQGKSIERLCKGIEWTRFAKEWLGIAVNCKGIAQKSSDWNSKGIDRIRMEMRWNSMDRPG